MIRLLDHIEVLTPADHQTHRRHTFDMPAACSELRIAFEYTPKLLPRPESAALTRAAVDQHAVFLTRRLSKPELVADWRAAVEAVLLDRGMPAIPNLLTISLDDATGAYRGAVHRQDPKQLLFIRQRSASPGLVRGALPAGPWWLTVSVHTQVAPSCTYRVQIGAETASSAASGPRSSA